MQNGSLLDGPWGGEDKPDEAGKRRHHNWATPWFAKRAAWPFRYATAKSILMRRLPIKLLRPGRLSWSKSIPRTI